MSLNRKLSIYDFNKICRTCLGEGDMKPLYKKCSQEISLIEMLMSVTLVEFNENNELPIQICLKCEKEVIQAYKFAKKCSETDNALRKCVNQFREESLNNTIATYHMKQNEAAKTIKCIKTQNSEMINSHYFEQGKIMKSENLESEKKLSTSKSYECKYCYMKFSNLQLLKLHRKDKIDALNSCGRKICKICSKSISYSRMNEHIRFHALDKQNLYSSKDRHSIRRNFRNEKRFCRTEYLLPINEKNVIENNLEVRIIKKTKNCEDDKNEVNNTSNNISLHLNSTSTQEIRTNKKKQKTYSCTICDLTFETSVGLKTHCSTVGHSHKRSENICNICRRKFDSKYNLRRHMMIHNNDRPHKCNICNKGFMQISSLVGHSQVHSGEKLFVCNICGRKFSQKGNLQRHLKIHSNTNHAKSMCNICGRKFNQKGNLQRHLKIHAKTNHAKNKSEPVYECEICHQKYHTKGVLTTHMLIHGDKTFLCSYCGKEFATLAGLNSHLKMHFRDRPFPCELCGKSFGHLGSLKSHINVHTGDKPFVCKLCNKAFKQTSHLKIHLRTHSGDRPYSCLICGKTFALNSNLTVHMRTHTGETPYLCPVCNKGFYDSSSMKRHLNKHGEFN